jgi:hypothetical protein
LPFHCAASIAPSLANLERNDSVTPFLLQCNINCGRVLL